MTFVLVKSRQRTVYQLNVDQTRQEQQCFMMPFLFSSYSILCTDYTDRFLRSFLLEIFIYQLYPCWNSIHLFSRGVDDEQFDKTCVLVKCLLFIDRQHSRWPDRSMRSRIEK